jgi:hypothetical protein
MLYARFLIGAARWIAAVVLEAVAPLARQLTGRGRVYFSLRRNANRTGGDLANQIRPSDIPGPAGQLGEAPPS